MLKSNPDSAKPGLVNHLNIVVLTADQAFLSLPEASEYGSPQIDSAIASGDAIGL